MIGFAIGSACLVGLAVLRRGRFGKRGCAGGASGRCGRGPEGHSTCGRAGVEGGPGCGAWRSGPGSFGRRFGGWRGGAWGALRSLGLSRAQWVTLRDGFEELRDVALGQRAVLRRSRQALVGVLRGEAFEEATLRAAYAEHDAALAALRTATTAFVARAHATLEPSQRARLAEWLELGPFGAAVVGGSGHDGAGA